MGKCALAKDKDGRRGRTCREALHVTGPRLEGESNDAAPGREKVCQCEAAGPSFTCDDGQQNGDESHVDCGGSCPACADCGPPNRLHWVFANCMGPNQIYGGTCVVMCATG